MAVLLWRRSPTCPPSEKDPLDLEARRCLSSSLRIRASRSKSQTDRFSGPSGLALFARGSLASTSRVVRCQRLRDSPNRYARRSPIR
jgi:hypothetical protein